MLSHMVPQFNFLRTYQTIFSKWLHHFIYPPAKYKGPSFSMSSSILIIVHVFDYSYPNSMKWLTAVLICIPLVTNDAENLFIRLLAKKKNLFKSF